MKILSCENIRQAERAAVESGRFTYAELMYNAGHLAAEKIAERFSVCGKRICIVCGCGNNGGDGLVIGKLLALKGAFVSFFLPLGAPKTDTARVYLDVLDVCPTVEKIPEECDILIDALFGIGLDRDITGTAADAVIAMNNCNAQKVAIDLPSGVFSDGGASDVAFKSDYTVTFIAPKPCFYLPQGGALCGEVSVIDIGADIVDYSYSEIDPPVIKRRERFSHKGDYGTVLLICGSLGMCGAEILAARAALRSGAGIVKAIVCDKNYSAFCSAVPEAVTIPVPTSPLGSPEVSPEVLRHSLSGVDAVLFGCGLSRGVEITSLLSRLLNLAEAPVVIDADGINALCSDISILRNTKSSVIITPHSGEMARLFNKTAADIERDRISYARDFAIPHRCTVVLKGANTIVASEKGRIYFNTTGNAGMATGGSGDVLGGVLVSMLASGRDALQAALDAVYIHGRAGDAALKNSCETALLPSDVIEGLKTAFSE